MQISDHCYATGMNFAGEIVGSNYATVLFKHTGKLKTKTKQINKQTKQGRRIPLILPGNFIFLAFCVTTIHSSTEYYLSGFLLSTHLPTEMLYFLLQEEKIYVNYQVSQPDTWGQTSND